MSNYQDKYNQAISAYLLEDYELSRNMTDSLLKENGDSTLLYILSGNIHEALGNSDKAIKEYRKAIHLSPDNPEAYNNVGVSYKKKGDFKKAETAFKQAGKLAPDRPDISYNLGNLFKLSGDLESAESWYKKSLEQDPSFIKAYNNLGTIFELSKDYEKAEEIYRRGLSMDKNNATLHYNLGITFQDRGQLDEAKTQYEESLKYRPGWTPSLGNLGEVLQNQGALEEAEKKFEQLLNKEPENVRAINNMGTIHAKKGDEEKARQYFKKALVRDPSYKTATLNLQQLYMKQNSLQEALEELNKQVTYHPSDMQIRLQIGDILTKQERYKEAEKVYNHVIERQTDNLEAYRALAALYAIEKRPDLVRSCVIEIFKLDPNDKTILLTLSETYLEGERYDEALKYIEDYLESFPADKKALHIKARILQKTSRQEEAASLYEQLDGDPDLINNPETLTDMAEAYFQSGEREKAVNKLETLLNLQGASTATEDINNLTQTLELYEKTVSSFEEGSDNWHNNLAKMRQITIRDLNQDKSQNYSTGPRLSQIPMDEEDAISLLDINAMEPVININEEEDTLIFEDDTENMDDVYTEMMKEGLIPEEEEVIEEAPAVQPAAPAYPPAPPFPASDPYPYPAPEPYPVEMPAPVYSAPAPADSEVPTEEKQAPYEDPLKETEKIEPRLDIAGMMNYLFTLSHDLPDEKRQVLIDKAIPLKMASVVKRLSGGRQFKEKVSSYDRRSGKRKNFNISEENMKNSLSAFRTLTEQHPDNLISSAFTKKMDELMTKIKPYL